MQDNTGKHYFSVTGALPLSTAWKRLRAALHAGQVQSAERAAPPLMKAVFRATYPPDQWESAMLLQMQVEDAEQRMIGSIKSGELPLWIAPVQGSHSERQLAADSLGEVNRRTLAGGRYLPFNEKTHVAYSYPLFIKQHDWERFFSGITPAAARIAATIRAESECRVWLKKQFAADPENKRTKASYKMDALALFGDRLSVRGFGRAWDTVASKAGRSKPGRKS